MLCGSVYQMTRIGGSMHVPARTRGGLLSSPRSAGRNPYGPGFASPSHAAQRPSVGGHASVRGDRAIPDHRPHHRRSHVPGTPGYSVSKNAISDLGVAPALPIFNPSVILLGLIVLAIAWFLFRAFRDRLLSIVAALAGVGAIAVGIFTEDFGFIHSLVSLWTFVFID